LKNSEDWEVRMRSLGVLCSLALFLFLIAPTRGYSQDREDNKPNQAQDQKDQKDNGKAKAKDNDKAKQDEKAARPDETRQQQEPNAGRQDEHQNRPEAARPEEQQRPAEQQRPMGNNDRAAQGMGRDNNQHPAADRGKRIPDDQFRAHFGREHHFHVQRNEVINVAQPVVNYGGYSFELEQAWPSDWSYDDDCYIDYIDGQYYLIDLLHPGIRIAVFLVG
jgi:hypothetical protein